MLQYQTTKKILSKFRNIPVFKRFLPSLFRRWYLFTKRRHHVSHVHGLEWLLDFQTLGDRRLAVWGQLENRQIEFMTQLIKDNHIKKFFDIGGFAGYYSIILKHRFPELDINAFEPHPHNRNQFHANLFLNKMSGDITLHPIALSKDDGQTTIGYHSERNRGNSRMEAENGFAVEKRRFDSLFDDKGETVLMKMDVEGFEKDVVEGMQEYLKNNHCILQIEAWESNADSLIEKMQGLGYEKFHSFHWDFYFRKKA